MNTGRCSALHPPGGTIPPAPSKKSTERPDGNTVRPFCTLPAARGSPFLSPSCRLHRLAQKKLRTVFERQNVPNKPSGLTESGKALQSLLLRAPGAQPAPAPRKFARRIRGWPSGCPHRGSLTYGRNNACGWHNCPQESGPSEANASTLSIKGNEAVSISTTTREPRAISSKCPPSPNPVISVAALRFMAAALRRRSRSNGWPNGRDLLRPCRCRSTVP